MLPHHTLASALVLGVDGMDLVQMPARPWGLMGGFLRSKAGDDEDSGAPEPPGSLRGADGTNLIFGDDTRISADGDRMAGGAGADLFRAIAGLGHIKILDFTLGADIISGDAIVGENRAGSDGDDVVACLQGVDPVAITLARDVMLTLRPGLTNLTNLP
jgi:hypothetical protein